MARILVLQDDPSWNSSLTRCLEEHHELIVVEEREAAIKALHEVIYDAVIVRVHLKNDAFFKFLKNMHDDSSLAKIAIICFCGRRSRAANVANSALKSASLALGAHAYLSIEEFCAGEECDLDKMRHAIESVIEHRVL